MQLKVFALMEDFDKNLPPTVIKLTTPNRSSVYVVGTAHFSRESQNDVSYVIRNVLPNITMVELCQARVHMLNTSEEAFLQEAGQVTMSKVQLINNNIGSVLISIT